MDDRKEGWIRRGVRGLGKGMEPADDDVSEIARKKRRFKVIVVFGIVMSLVAFLVSISISSGGIIPVSEALASLVSSIQKGGENLDPVENYIYYSRLPRAIAAVAVVIVLFKTILGSFAPAVVDQYQVPDLYNMTIEEAENDPRIEGVFEIQKAGSEFSTDVPEGHILRQDPKKEETRKGSQLVIQVWVSAGEETGEVPDLENKSEQDARILLEKLNKEYNLELTVEAPEELKQFSEEITEGYVIKTEPAQGEILKKGDTVKLILSKGPDIKPVTVLPFVGMSIDSVLSQLESYKLTCDAADVEVVDSDKPGGTIVWQSPASGETVPEWTTIKFRVSAGLASSALPITVDIPQNGKDIVKVEIYVGDEPNPQYSETVYEADGAVSTTLYGTGRKMVKVYFDGVLDQKQSYERSFG